MGIENGNESCIRFAPAYKKNKKNFIDRIFSCLKRKGLILEKENYKIEVTPQWKEKNINATIDGVKQEIIILENPEKDIRALKGNVPEKLVGEQLFFSHALLRLKLWDAVIDRWELIKYLEDNPDAECEFLTAGYGEYAINNPTDKERDSDSNKQIKDIGLRACFWCKDGTFIELNKEKQITRGPYCPPYLALSVRFPKKK